MIASASSAFVKNLPPQLRFGMSIAGRWRFLGRVVYSGARGREFESPRSDQQIQAFFDLMRTPVGGNVGELVSN